MVSQVKIIRPALAEILSEPGIRGVVMGVAAEVKKSAESTASDAEKGEGGTLTGYASAGFSAEWQQRGKRPRGIVRSNLNNGIQWRVHFSTIQRWGVAHLRQALYKHTTRGG